MTPHPYVTLSDADLWEHYRERGLSAADATKHVELRRQAREGAAAAELARSQSQDVGPAATAAQSILEQSPAGGVNMMGSSGALAGRAAQAVPGLGAIMPGLVAAGLVGKMLPSNLLQRGEAAVAGMPYEQFAATEKTSKEANPLSAMAGPLGWLIAPGVGVGGMMKKRLAQKAATRTEELAALRLSNELKKKALARMEQQSLGPLEGVDPARYGANAATYQRQPINYSPISTPASAPPAPMLQPGNVVQPIAPQGLQVTGLDLRPPPPEPPAISIEQAQERALRALGKGKTLPYHARGGKAAEEILPGVVSPTQPLPLDRTDPKAIAAALKVQLQNAQNMGLPVSPEQLAKYLHGVSPEVMQQVLKELGH